MEKINLFNELYEKQNIPECISIIGYKDNVFILYNSEDLFLRESGEKKIFSIQTVPDYLSIKYNALFNKKVLKEYRLGYASKLNEFKDIKNYVKNQFRKNAKTIFKNINRLETCFEVNYVLFYGAIERNQYDFLMESLYEMLKKRFKQRNDSNYRLNSWEELYTRTFNLIKLKKASLFVIYNGDQPIQINIQYHFKDILVASVASYDIDFQKFGLGNTALYKQIEWCINNGYTIFDLGHGDLAYKQRWSNMIYNFDHHVVYSKDNFKSIFFANLVILKVKTKAYLRSKKADIILKNLKKSFSKSSKKINNNEKSYKVFNLASLEDEFETFNKIEWQSLEYSFLRKFVCNFLYHNLEHFNNVEVFQDKYESENFILKGGNNFQKIIFY